MLTLPPLQLHLVRPRAPTTVSMSRGLSREGAEAAGPRTEGATGDLDAGVYRPRFTAVCACTLLRDHICSYLYTLSAQHTQLYSVIRIHDNLHLLQPFQCGHPAAKCHVDAYVSVHTSVESP